MVIKVKTNNPYNRSYLTADKEYDAIDFKEDAGITTFLVNHQEFGNIFCRKENCGHGGQWEVIKT